MKILVDENIPRMTVAALRNLGHDVRDVRGSHFQGVPDDRLWEEARREARLLITTDKGSAVRRQDTHHGILIVRLRQPTRLKIHDRVLRALARFGPDKWPGLLVVMRDAVQSEWRSRARPRRKKGRG
ncbi:MAG: DUF5615 family PIN-like protein [Planctomycetes bacterium]|nr:DUF5615 family PIN-like protein [Planctomycetota bacterium]